MFYNGLVVCFIIILVIAFLIKINVFSNEKNVKPNDINVTMEPYEVKPQVEEDILMPNLVGINVDEAIEKLENANI